MFTNSKYAVRARPVAAAAFGGMRVAGRAGRQRVEFAPSARRLEHPSTLYLYNLLRFSMYRGSDRQMFTYLYGLRSVFSISMSIDGVRVNETPACLIVI